MSLLSVSHYPIRLAASFILRCYPKSFFYDVRARRLARPNTFFFYGNIFNSQDKKKKTEKTSAGPAHGRMAPRDGPKDIRNRSRGATRRSKKDPKFSRVVSRGNLPCQKETPKMPPRDASRLKINFFIFFHAVSRDVSRQVGLRKFHSCELSRLM